MKTTRRPLKYPGLLLDDMCLPDTPHNRRLLEQVDGVVSVDFSDNARIRRMRHPGVEVFGPGTRWMIGYIYDDHVEIQVRTYPAQQARLPRAS